MVKSGLCLISLLNSTTFGNEKDTIIRMIHYLTTYSTALLSSSSRYNDYGVNPSHLYTLSLLLNQKDEYLLSMKADVNIENANAGDHYNDLLKTFRRIMTTKKNEKKKIFLKRKQ